MSDVRNEDREAGGGQDQVLRDAGEMISAAVQQYHR